MARINKTTFAPVNPNMFNLALPNSTKPRAHLDRENSSNLTRVTLRAHARSTRVIVETKVKGNRVNYRHKNTNTNDWDLFMKDC